MMEFKIEFDDSKTKVVELGTEREVDPDEVPEFVAKAKAAITDAVEKSGGVVEFKKMGDGS